jgi:hypothetical protein
MVNTSAIQSSNIESETYVAIGGQSASLSEVKHPSGACDQIFITVSFGFVDVGRSL